TPIKLDNLVPELLEGIIAYLHTERDFVRFTSTCRTLRAFHTPQTWALCLVRKHGTKTVLASDDLFEMQETTNLSIGAVMYHLVSKFKADIHVSRQHQPKGSGEEEVLSCRGWDGDPLEIEDYPFYWATLVSDLRLVGLILKRGGVDVHYRYDMILCVAAACGNVEVAKMLLEVDCPKESGGSLLNYAAKFGHMDMVELVLTCGCDVRTGLDTALVWAAVNGHRRMAELLIDHGADLHMDNDRPFRAACYENRLELAQFLLDRGARIQGDDGGQSIIHTAALRGYSQIVRLMLDNGVDINVGMGSPLVDAA
ncbi:hypothetical protein HK102_006125, partial [Quaeritorhiza haematococci]